MGLFSSKKPTPAPLPAQISKVKAQAALLNSKHRDNGSEIKLPDLAKTHGFGASSSQSKSKSSQKVSAKPAAKPGVQATSMKLNSVNMSSTSSTSSKTVVNNHTTVNNYNVGFNFGDGSAGIKGGISLSGSIFKVL